MVRLRAKSINVVDETEEIGIEMSDFDSDAAFGGAPGPDHVGAWLREARETTGRDLRDISAHLRIRYPYLLAIEEGRFDDLPGRAYAVGFIRSYSEHLGLDGEKMVGRFKSQVDVVAPEQNLKFPTPVPEGRFPGASVLLVSAILAAALVGAWYYYQNRGAIELVRVPPPPEPQVTTAASGDPTSPQPPPAMASDRAAEPASPSVGVAPGSAAVGPREEPLAPAPEIQPPQAPTVTADSTPQSPDTPVALPSGRVSDATPPPTVTQVEPPRLNEAGQPLAPAEQAAETTTATPPATATAAPAPTSAPAPTAAQRREPAEPARAVAALPAIPAMTPSDDTDGRVYGLSNRDARVVLRARGDSWVQVRDASQNALLTRMLHDGDSYHVPNREGLVMSVGDPSALSVSIDGEPAFRLSAENAPISDIALDPDRLRDGTAIR